MIQSEIVKDDKVALVLGTEGIVAPYLLDRLVKHPAYKKIVSISFKNVTPTHREVSYYRSSFGQIDFRSLGANDFFLALDKTFFSGKNKVEESELKFFPKMILNAFRAGIGQMMYLSAGRSNKNAWFYGDRARGIMEDVVVQMDFWSCHIFRPSLIIDSETNTNQWGRGVAEKISNRVDKVTGGWLKRNRPLEASVIADAMINVAQKFNKGTHYYSSDWLQDFENIRSNKEII